MSAKILGAMATKTGCCALTARRLSKTLGGAKPNTRALAAGRPLTFDDEFSALGVPAIRHIGVRGIGYLGFYNSRQHAGRVWLSMAVRIWEEDMLAQILLDGKPVGPKRLSCLPPVGNGTGGDSNINRTRQPTRLGTQKIWKNTSPTGPETDAPTRLKARNSSSREPKRTFPPLVG